MNNNKEKGIFISHTKEDREFCDRFDSACASVGIKRFRSELETIETPTWSSIRNAIRKSCALFLLVGKELVRFQESNDPETRKRWRYTQNWIAFEIGVACERDEDVWVLCDDVLINFPVPYLNNYFPIGLRKGRTEPFDCIVEILNAYKQGGSFPFIEGEEDQRTYSSVVCRCGAKFNLLELVFIYRPSIVCPQCLRTMGI